MSKSSNKKSLHPHVRGSLFLGPVDLCDYYLVFTTIIVYWEGRVNKNFPSFQFRSRWRRNFRAARFRGIQRGDQRLARARNESGLENNAQFRKVFFAERERPFQSSYNSA